MYKHNKRLLIYRSLFPFFYIMERIQYWIPSLRSRMTKLPIDYYQ